MELLTIKEVAEYFRVSERTIHRWIKTNGLRAYKFGADKGSTLRIAKSEIERFTENHKKRHG